MDKIKAFFILCMLYVTSLAHVFCIFLIYKYITLCALSTQAIDPVPLGYFILQRKIVGTHN